MAAAAKDGFLVFTDDVGKVVQHESFNNTDVANAYATFYSNGTLTFVIVKQDCWLSDVVLEAAPTDTTQMQLFINGTDVNIRLLDAGVVAAVNNRLSAPIGKIRAGSMIQLKELT